MAARSSPKSEARDGELVPARRTPIPTAAALLREAGLLPAFGPAGVEDSLDPSPLKALTPKQRRARLVGLLELHASWGDVGAAAEALRHHRWEDEMKRGKAPQRVDLAMAGEIRVIDTLSAPPGTPLRITKRAPQPA